MGMKEMWAPPFRGYFRDGLEATRPKALGVSGDTYFPGPKGQGQTEPLGWVVSNLGRKKRD